MPPQVIGVAIAAGCGPVPSTPAPARPPIEITTDAELDPKSVPAYSGDHAKVYADIDRKQAQHLANVQRWLRQPSVSAQNVGVQQMAEMVRDDLKKLGCQESELVPTAGHPGVWASCDYGAPKTLLV